MASASSVNLSSVGLTTCVGTGFPLKCTTDLRTKLIPFSVTVTGVVPCVMRNGSMPLMAGCGERAGSGTPALLAPSCAWPPPGLAFIKATTHGDRDAERDQLRPE